MKITREMLCYWQLCYRQTELAKSIPVGGLTPLEVADFDTSVIERVWALLRSDVLGAHLQPVLDGFAERAVRRVLGRSGVSTWETWAEKWLSGDHSALEAFQVAEAVEAAAAEFSIDEIEGADAAFAAAKCAAYASATFGLIATPYLVAHWAAYTLPHQLRASEEVQQLAAIKAVLLAMEDQAPSPNPILPSARCPDVEQSSLTDAGTCEKSKSESEPSPEPEAFHFRILYSPAQSDITLFAHTSDGWQTTTWNRDERSQFGTPPTSITDPRRRPMAFYQQYLTRQGYRYIDSKGEVTPVVLAIHNRAVTDK